MTLGSMLGDDMFWIVYFPMISVLSANEPNSTLKEMVFNAKVREALLFAGKRTDGEQHSVSADILSEDFRISGDFQLALGRFEEAEESLRKSSRLIRHSKSLLRIRSCRNTGWQAFFLHRFSTALSCFTRLLNENELSVPHRLEALTGTALVLHTLGYLNEAYRYLEEMRALALREQLEDWQQLAHTINFDFTIQYELRQSPQLTDHVYWQVAAANFMPPALSSLPIKVMTSDLLTRRLDYLRQLHAFALGSADVANQLQAHLNWASAAELDLYQRTVRVEIALAALATDATRLAQSLLNFNHFGQGLRHTVVHNNIEYFYCLAKACQQIGRIEESMHHYGRYALLAMQSMRTASLPADFHSQQRVRNTAHTPLDDVCARLPGKYRRAYTYLLGNLSRPDLSVREVAAHIGVTERALQMAFKTYVGLSPTEVIRRQRMERIRNDLLNEAGASIADVAEKWGVQNRSTLVNGYRKEFQETPSDTLMH
ncbi:AraC family transcriptional regulator [Mycoavidus cysteinexigens]|nr:AraC family transcriptional regulator [Mycoavidus cysteinexigens]